MICINSIVISMLYGIIVSTRVLKLLDAVLVFASSIINAIKTNDDVITGLITLHSICRNRAIMKSNIAININPVSFVCVLVGIK
ncbi:hypothetical protein PMIT1303_00767 [Prochlorococcus sp. MIT 1303]|nr:hypothetical protein PMIT1303_00767 [Prochlorococcus sp. MIT 1303]